MFECSFTFGKNFQLRDAAFKGCSLGITEWAFSLVKEDGEADSISAALIVIAQCLVHVYDDDLSVEEKKVLSEISLKTFEIIFPVVKKFIKTPEVASNGFACLTFSVQFHPNLVIEKQCIPCVSILLAMNVEIPQFAQNFIAFLYEAARANFQNEILAVKGCIPTVLKAMKLHPEIERVVAPGAALINVCGHQNKDEILVKACMKFPESEVLRDYLAFIQKSE